MIELCEIFCSIQGESTYSGKPCIFIRFSGCNLRCKWCDTAYSYDPSFSMSIASVIKKISTYEPFKLVEITGGEPLLQDNVYPLIEELLEKKYRILMETNGSLSIEKLPRQIVKIIDVKCPSSGHEDSFLLDNLKLMSIRDELKFVIACKDDYLFTKSFILRHLSTVNNPILLSPITETLQPSLLSRWIIADKLNVRLQLQLHKIIWDKKQRSV